MRLFWISTISTISIVVFLLASASTKAVPQNTMTDKKTIDHIVVFGGASADTGNLLRSTREIQGKLNPDVIQNGYRENISRWFAGAGNAFIGSTTAFPFMIYLNAGKYPWYSPSLIPPYLVIMASSTFSSYYLGLGAPLESYAAYYLSSLFAWYYSNKDLPTLPPPSIYGLDGRATNGHQVFPEFLAEELSSPEKKVLVKSGAYAGSHPVNALAQVRNRFHSTLKHLFHMTHGLHNAMDLPNDNYQNLDNMVKALFSLDEELARKMLVEGFPPDLSMQVKFYLENPKLTGQKKDKNKILYIISYNGNDFIETDGSSEAETIDAIKRQMTTLYESNITSARDFALLKSMIHHTPENRHLETIIENYNRNLQSMADNFSIEHPDSTITLFGGDELIDIAKNNVLETNQPCLMITEQENLEISGYEKVSLPPDIKNHILKHNEGRHHQSGITEEIVGDQKFLEYTVQLILEAAQGKLQRCRNPNKYLFFDGLVLSEEGHKLLAKNLCFALLEKHYNIACGTRIRSPISAGQEDYSYRGKVHKEL